LAVQIDWQVWCFPGDDVLFGIASVAQPASGGNIFIRIGSGCSAGASSSGSGE
jgi:hypothetical protein